MSLTVKAYLIRENKGDEIRRFAVDQDVTTSHPYMREKITHIFSTLKNKSFDLFWKDSDNDMIAFSSDEEQTEALGFVNDGVFKVFIKEQPTKTEKPRDEPESNTRHPGVECDGCEGPVIGIRFKCIVCPDYDLCSTCEGKGIHLEHNMMRISKPDAGAFMGFGFFPPPPHHGPPHHGPPPPPPHHGHPPPPHHHGHPPPPHHHGGPPHDDDMQGPDGPWGPGPQGPWNFPPPFGVFGRGRGNFRRMMRKCWKKWHDGEEKDKTEKDQKNDETKTDETKKDDTKPKSNGEDMDTGSSDEGECSPTEDFLKNVGQNVAAMLDPLGIDVEIDVEHGGARQRFDADWGPWGFNTWGGRGRHCRGRGRGRGKCSRTGSCPKTTKDQQKQTDDQKMAEDKPAEQKVENVVEMETGEAGGAAKTTEELVDLNDYIVETPPDTETGEVGAKPNEGESSPDRDWTILDDKSSPADSTTQAAAGATGIYPAVPEPEIPPPPADPVIANALDHMSAMGFSDEGGWLTNLLLVTKGDINKALDAIRANRGQRK